MILGVGPLRASGPLHPVGTSRRGKIVKAVVVRFTGRRVLDLRYGFGGSTSRKLSDSPSSLTTDYFIG